MPSSLKITVGDEKSSIEASLQRREAVVIGRGSDCDVVIQDAKASRRHCKLSRAEEGFVLEDLGSRNGTYVNGGRISAPVLLKANQAFKIGDTVFYLA
jgi:pSer/pThr/pTyr-binding forkhead associated (FHA) protein